MTTYVDPVAQAAEYQQLLLSVARRPDDPAEVQAATPAALRELFALPRARQLRERPEPSEWSVFECVAHIVDAEIVYQRPLSLDPCARRAGAPGYDQDLWVDSLHADGRARPTSCCSVFEPAAGRQSRPCGCARLSAIGALRDAPRARPGELRARVQDHLRSRPVPPGPGPADARLGPRRWLKSSRGSLLVGRLRPTPDRVPRRRVGPAGHR